MFDFKEFREKNDLTQKEAASFFEVSQAFISQIEKGTRPIPDIFISKIKANNEFIKPVLETTQSKNLIPFYDDVIAVGGMNEIAADMGGVSEPADYIDTGDWFREATAAIRHYGGSMIEYPPGSILALKEVQERQLIVWGKDYVIETNEYRITKRVQRGRGEDYIKAYSSNTETYPDGHLIHEPLDVAWNDINRIFLVLGYVVKKNGGAMVFSNQKK